MGSGETRRKLGKITADDADGYHRVMCPAVLGKLRCPLRPDSMTLDYQRPQILAPPEHPPPCCTQQTVTIPPEVHAKTAQKHDYPSQAHRRSYARRSAAERTFSTAKDPASNNISRGWCRLTGLTPIALLAACLLIVRSQRILSAWDTRQADNNQRAASGLPPKTRRRRRKTLASLAATPPWHRGQSTPRAAIPQRAAPSHPSSHSPGISPPRQNRPPASKQALPATTSKPTAGCASDS